MWRSTILDLKKLRTGVEKSCGSCICFYNSIIETASQYFPVSGMELLCFYNCDNKNVLVFVTSLLQNICLEKYVFMCLCILYFFVAFETSRNYIHVFQWNALPGE